MRPEFRGYKIGRMLCHKLIEDAREMGYRTMVLDTLQSLEGAVHTYRKLGFEEVDAYYENPLQGVLFFQKEL